METGYLNFCPKFVVSILNATIFVGVILVFHCMHSFAVRTSLLCGVLELLEKLNGHKILGRL